jgi:hypothetical protein
MELQKIILGQYVLLNGDPTLKFISDDTGIQITRVFRLFNGSLMKLSEYQVFQQKVKVKMGLTNTLENIAFDCSLKLSPAAIKEIEIFLIRKMDLWKLKQTALATNKNTNQQSA